MTPTTATLVDQLGAVFATFDERTQDSGHVSYGVETADGGRLFVKTAGGPAASPGGATHSERVRVLQSAAAIQEEVEHHGLVPLRRVLDASDGVAIVYDWFDGELLRCPAERRTDPAEAHVRFQHLHRDEIVAALDVVIDLHVELERRGWIAGDFYDGCLMYDFARSQLKVIDLEAYRRGAYVNDVGRLPGSTRFMAPEEHRRGSRIDARTTVHNLGRMVEIFLSSRHGDAELEKVTATATAAAPAQRHRSVADLQDAWRTYLCR